MITYENKLITIERPQDADTLRKALIANAYSIIDVSAINQRQIFEEILGPIHGKWDLDRPFHVYQSNGRWITEGISTCGLVALGLWRRMNVDMSSLYQPYIFGTAVSSIVGFAKKNNAWQPAWKGPLSDLHPQFGDCCIIGQDINTHVLTTVGYSDGNNTQLISVDGGQTGVKNLQCIKKVQRDWVQKGANNIFQPYLGTRILQGWVIFDLLPFKDSTIIVPENWESITI